VDVVVSTEGRYPRTPDGAFWTVTAQHYDFWARYLSVFDRAKVVARVYPAAQPPDGAIRADGPGVVFHPMPNYVGPRQYLLKAVAVRKSVSNVVGDSDAVIFRVGSRAASILVPKLRKTGHPYAVEIIGDPYDVFAAGAIEHPARPLFRWWLTREMQCQCRYAVAAAYVTSRMRQRYPCPGYVTHYAGIRLRETDFVSQPRAPRSTEAATLCFVGSLQQPYKAPDVVIEAVATGVASGLDLHLVVLGDGRYRPVLEAYANRLGLGDRIRFLGPVPPGAAVREQLDGADLFVLPSRADTVPKAMLEAMARGLPCIGSTIGGFPDLLPAEDLVPPGDTVALATKIREIVTDPRRMAAMSARNLTRAQEYREEVLRERRDAFYQHVRAVTARWVAQHGQCG
jgi:glycosyltransferase involved in cell wall biosynthesis